ncbi:MAG: hypothetical protein OEY59_12375 [Deltaproteobacteria bacterium]|nr:hypothetical protein [Deltaproteobacteria bacterium]
MKKTFGYIITSILFAFLVTSCMFGDGKNKGKAVYVKVSIQVNNEDLTPQNKRFAYTASKAKTTLILAVEPNAALTEWEHLETAISYGLMNPDDFMVELTVPLSKSIQLIQLDFWDEYTLTRLLEKQPDPFVSGISDPFTISASTTQLYVKIPFIPEEYLSQRELDLLPPADQSLLYNYSTAQLIAKGKSSFENNYLHQSEVYYKLAEFRAGNSVSNDADEARFWYGLTRLAGFIFDTSSDSDMTNGLKTVGDVLDALNCESTNRDWYNTLDASSGAVMPTCPDSISSWPVEMDNFEELQDILVNIPFYEWKGALMNLEAISDSIQTGITDPNDQSVTQIDYGEVMLLKGVIKSILSLVYASYAPRISLPIPQEDIQSDPTPTTWWECEEAYPGKSRWDWGNSLCSYDNAVVIDYDITADSYINFASPDYQSYTSYDNTCKIAHPTGWMEYVCTGFVHETWGTYCGASMNVCVYRLNDISLEDAFAIPSFLTQRDNGYFTQEIQNMLASGSDDLEAGIESIFNETDDQADDLFQLNTTDTFGNQVRWAQEDLDQFKTEKNKFTDCILTDECRLDNGTPNDLSDDQVFNFSPLFQGFNFRDYFPEFQGDFAVKDSLPDPTLNGIILKLDGETPTEYTYRFQNVPEKTLARFTSYQAGTDGQLDTADDTNNAFFVFQFDDGGNLHTGFQVYNAWDGNDVANGWGESWCRRTTRDNNAIRVKSQDYNSNCWWGSQIRYILYNYDADGRLEREDWYSTGADMIENTGDDSLQQVWVYSYDTSGKRTERTFYTSPGSDGDWATLADNQHGSKFVSVYDAEGYVTRENIFIPGTDGILGTADDVKMYRSWGYELR